MKASDPTGSHHTFDYKMLRVLGCQAYTQIKKEHWDKLSPKANNLIMVGYNQISKAYRLLDPDLKKVVISRNVVFDKKLLPFTINPSKNQEAEFDFDMSDALFQKGGIDTQAREGSRDLHHGVWSTERQRNELRWRDLADPTKIFW
jgi:hypothetical protein